MKENFSKSRKSRGKKHQLLNLFQNHKHEGDHVKGLRISAVFLGLLLSFGVQASHHGGNGSPGQDPGQSTPADGSIQPCMNQGQVLPVMNEQALQWRETQASGFKTRALISGTVDEVFPDQTGHRHFSLKVGPNPGDHIEVIYNESFGAMPLPQTGEEAQACGDYIVATQQNGGYAASPDGALVHWVHKNTDHSSHDNGYVVLNGVVYGNENGYGN